MEQKKILDGREFSVDHIFFCAPHKKNMTTDLALLAPGWGNSNSPANSDTEADIASQTSEKAPRKEKRPAGANRWTFTWNNFPEDFLEQLAPAFLGTLWVAGKEFAPSTGTPHLQGYVEFPKKVRPIGYKGIPKTIHWGDKNGKPARGTRNENYDYCVKDGDFYGNMTREREKISMEIEEDDILKWDDMLPWGREVVEMVDGRLPDKLDRRIFWIWSSAGKQQKTEVARYLCYHHDAVVIQGGRKHVLAVAYKNPAPIYILTVPRTDEGFVSYASIELIKDSLYMSAFGVEATGMVNRKKPWVIVIGNFGPDKSKLSEDRWVERRVDPEVKKYAPDPWEL